MALMLNTFLGCCTLRTGCFFMGYPGAISSALAIIFSFGGIIVFGQRGAYLKGDDLFYNEIALGVCIIILVTASIAFSLYVVLLVALHQYRPRLMKAFLINMTIYLVISFILALILIIMKPVFAIRMLMSYVWSIYYMLVCRSYYYKMKEEVSIQSEIKPV